jgi:hypothetical protein
MSPAVATVSFHPVQRGIRSLEYVGKTLPCSSYSAAPVLTVTNALASAVYVFNGENTLPKNGSARQ